MKTFLMLLALILSVNVGAQLDTTKLIAYNQFDTGPEWGNDDVPYLVGSYRIPGYELETRICSKEESITLSNGRIVAGLSCILLEKTDYVGGTMVFDKDTTTITNVTVVPVGNGAEFTVSGEDFSMSFTLRTGMILRYESNYATFNTENKGIWTINKKV